MSLTVKILNIGTPKIFTVTVRKMEWLAFYEVMCPKDAD